MWTHSGWEDCDAVCGGGKIKEKCTNTHICILKMCMYIQYACIYTIHIYVYTICIYMYIRCVCIYISQLKHMVY